MIYITRILFTVLAIFCYFPHAYAYNDSDILPLIKACADIASYSAETTDENELMLKVLFTHNNFKIVTDKTLKTDKSGSLNMCNAEFIQDVMYKVFRIDAPTPTPDKLNELGYYYNNGYYYYSGGYSIYYATNVNEIVKTVQNTDGSVNIIFSNTYVEGDNKPQSEISEMKLKKDNLGYYVSEINMNTDLTDMELTSSPVAHKSNYSESILKYMPLAIALIAIFISAIVFCVFILR